MDNFKFQFYVAYFLAFEGHLGQKNQKIDERGNFLFVLAKSGDFAIIFLILT